MHRVVHRCVICILNGIFPEQDAACAMKGGGNCAAETNPNKRSTALHYVHGCVRIEFSTNQRDAACATIRLDMKPTLLCSKYIECFHQHNPA